MKKTIFSLLIAFACVVSFSFVAKAPVTEKTKATKIKIVNNSKWDIDNIYISNVDENEWGNDLLGSDEILSPGEFIYVYADCYTYDVKLVDEDEIECELYDVDICSGNETWFIGDLTKCGD